MALDIERTLAQLEEYITHCKDRIASRSREQDADIAQLQKLQQAWDALVELTKVISTEAATRVEPREEDTQADVGEVQAAPTRERLPARPWVAALEKIGQNKVEAERSPHGPIKHGASYGDAIEIARAYAREHGGRITVQQYVEELQRRHLYDDPKSLATIRERAYGHLYKAKDFQLVGSNEYEWLPDMTPDRREMPSHVVSSVRVPGATLHKLG